MLTSMTGYGRVSFPSSLGRFVIEIQSLNRKFLESFISLPKQFMRFEVEIKKWVAKEITRGQISVRISFTQEAKQVKELLPDLVFLKKLKAEWDKVAKELDLSKEEVDLSFLSKQMEEMSLTQTSQDDKKIKAILQEGVDKALKELMGMKRKEGAVLARDLQKRVLFLEKCIQQIKDHAPLSCVKYRQKLEKRLEEFAESKDLDERILREIAIFSEKVDITEEIVRFKAHLEQFAALLTKNQAVGKKMEFLIQELAREINTIAAKSSDVIIAKIVIETKTELEKIREQVQNIE